MAKITYANKQTAVDPNNPAANEIYFSTDANEVKASVNFLYDAIANIGLVNGFVSGPNLVATSTDTVAIQTFTQNIALVYNANGFQYTIAAGVADTSYAGAPDATFSKGCIIQGNGTTISLKQGVAASTVIYPTPDTGYVTIYSFLLTTSGITDINSQLAGYAQMNELNTGNLDITGDYLKNGSPIGVLTTQTFTQANLVSTGDGFFKLPLVLTGTQCILAVKITLGGNTYQKPASDWINDEIINFDSNATQTITVITS